MDKSTIIGLLIGTLGILIGNSLDGGHINSLLSLTAFIIVFSGTLGATVLSNTTEDLKTGFALLKKGFEKDNDEYQKNIAAKIIEASKIVRKENVLAISKKVEGYSDPFMKDVFQFMLDGAEPAVLREVFESEIDVEESHLLSGAKVWQDAGGFAPTIGIIGAVLGLIHVMANLTDTSQLGRGIAIAFVATIYGVAGSNLILIPIGNKIKNKIKKEMQVKEMIVEGGVAIVSGLSPLIIEQKMKSFLKVKSLG